MTDDADLPPGTPDLPIFEAVSPDEVHGGGVPPRTERIPGGAPEIPRGVLHRVLHRLERRGPVESERGASASDRRAGFHRPTRAGEWRLGADEASRSRPVEAMARVLLATPREISR